MSPLDESPSLVHFVCVAPLTAHVGVSEGRSQFRLIDDRWAFCPHNIGAHGHAWEAIDGVTLIELRQRYIG